MARTSTEPKTNLRKAMNLRGMTAVQLATRTGIPVSTINLAAGGFQRLRPDRVEAVAAVLRVTPEELRDVTGTKPSTDFLAEKPKPRKTKEPEPAPKQEPEMTKVKLIEIVRKLAGEVEKQWLHTRQLERRVRALEAQVKELADD